MIDTDPDNSTARTDYDAPDDLNGEGCGPVKAIAILSAVGVFCGLMFAASCQVVTAAAQQIEVYPAAEVQRRIDATEAEYRRLLDAAVAEERMSRKTFDERIGKVEGGVAVTVQEVEALRVEWEQDRERVNALSARVEALRLMLERSELIGDPDELVDVPVTGVPEVTVQIPLPPAEVEVEGLTVRVPRTADLTAASKLVRPGGELLIERGGTYWLHDPIYGHNGLTVEAYGEGEPPLIECRQGLLYGNGARGVTVRGVEAYAPTRDPDDPRYVAQEDRQVMGACGVMVLNGGGAILIEDVTLRLFRMGVVAQGVEPQGGRAARYLTGVTIRDSKILDSWSHWDGPDSSGVYASWVDGLTIEDSVLDHNGWHATAEGGVGTYRNHNGYFQTTTKNVRVEGSLISRPGNLGVQLRGGGELIDNTFALCQYPGFINLGGTWAYNVVQDVALTGRPDGRNDPGARQGLQVIFRPEGVPGPGPVGKGPYRIVNNVVARRDGGRKDFGQAYRIEDGIEPAEFAGNVYDGWATTDGNPREVDVVPYLMDPVALIGAARAGELTAADYNYGVREEAGVAQP